MNVPPELLYTKEHEWIIVDNDTGTVGISDYAQQQLGDVVYVELPETGDAFNANDAFASLESVKAVSEVYSPVSGRVVEVNEALIDAPETINEDPYGRGWLIRLELDDTSEVDELMSADEYTAYVEQEAKEE